MTFLNDCFDSHRSCATTKKANESQVRIGSFKSSSRTGFLRKTDLKSFGGDLRFDTSDLMSVSLIK